MKKIDLTKMLGGDDGSTSMLIMIVGGMVMLYAGSAVILSGWNNLVRDLPRLGWSIAGLFIFIPGLILSIKHTKNTRLWMVGLAGTLAFFLATTVFVEFVDRIISHSIEAEVEYYRVSLLASLGAVLLGGIYFFTAREPKWIVWPIVCTALLVFLITIGNAGIL